MCQTPKPTEVEQSPPATTEKKPAAEKQAGKVPEDKKFFSVPGFLSKIEKKPAAKPGKQPPKQVGSDQGSVLTESFQRLSEIPEAKAMMVEWGMEAGEDLSILAEGDEEAMRRLASFLPKVKGLKLLKAVGLPLSTLRS